ncbi:type II toxin-antitoxin system HicB family antitoxin [uncultured Treponema sp.]|uniref:type II toxin-antitoxin system HicB family antitoxin n=2 Tax=Treponemataceae TaxID=2845253 RepID=UPI0025926223|nr:type II toxin-antitoxin system HicB family antitoxin [uncultured Treponema sp.]
MSMEYTYWKDKDFYIGYLNDFPDYKTQAYSVSELEENLKSLYDDIKSDEIPFIRHVGKLEMA